MCRVQMCRHQAFASHHGKAGVDYEPLRTVGRGSGKMGSLQPLELSVSIRRSVSVGQYLSISIRRSLVATRERGQLG